MAANRSTRKRGRPATTPEARERQLISLSYDLAEKQLIEGTASSQVVTHFLKMGATRERLEQEKLQGENRLIGAKVDQISSGARIEELYEEAIKAMKTYSGQDDEEYYD